MHLLTFLVTSRTWKSGLAALLVAAVGCLPSPVKAQEQPRSRPGEQIWMGDVGARIAAAGAVITIHAEDRQDVRTLFVVGDRSGAVTAFDAAMGDIDWGPVDLRRTDDSGRHVGPGIIASPAVLSSEGIVVFSLRDGRVVALDAAKRGQQVWAIELGRPGAPRPTVAAPPTAAADGSIIVATLTGVVYALDPSSGKKIWTYEAGRPIEHPPIATLDGRVILTVESPERSLVALKLDGREDRGFDPIAFGVLPTGAPALDGEGSLVAAHADGKLLVRRPNGSTATAEIEGVPVAQSVEEDGRTFWELSNLKIGGHRLERLRWSAGKIEKTGSVFRAQGEAVGDVALDGGGNAVYATRDGTLRAVTADGKEAWVFPPEEGASFLASPVLALGMSFIAAEDGRVFAVATGSESGAVSWPGFRRDSERRAHALGPHFLPGERIFDAPPMGWEYDISPVWDDVTDRQSVQEEKGFEQIAKRMHRKGEAPVYAIGAGRYRIALKPSSETNDGKPARDFPKETRGRYPDRLADGQNDLLRLAIVQVHDVPIQRIEVGREIPVPKNAHRASIPGTGPRARAAGSKTATADPNLRPLVWRRVSGTFHAVVPGDWVIDWPVGASGQTFPVRVRVEWPRDERRIQHIVRGAQPFMVSGEDVFAHATVFKQDGSFEPLEDGLFDPRESGRFVVVLSDTPNPIEGHRLGFLPIETVGWRDPRAFIGSRAALIGRALPIPADHEDPDRTPFVLNERARAIMGREWGFHNREERSGPIIPVNVEDPGDPEDNLVLALYERGVPVMDADGESGVTESPFPGWRYQARFYGDQTRRTPPKEHARISYLPSKSVLFDADWPEVGDEEVDADLIVIAAQNDGGYPLNPERFGNYPEVYRQPDKTQAGYNPNEEHAEISRGDRKLWVFRSDLNDRESSRPFVLVAYKDPTDSMAPKIKVIAVKPEERAHDFILTARAGDRLPPPQPIGLTNIVPIRQFSLDESVTFQDRTGELWARRAGHDNGSASVVVRYCYEKHETFDDPGSRATECPGAKGMLSWLSAYAARKRSARGETEDLNAPIDVTFKIAWPDDVPVLRPGQTLLTARDNLPSIYGERGVEIAYQQTEALGQGPSVRLFDALVERSAELASLPPSLRGAKSEEIGRSTFFVDLPPHLRHQFYFESPYGLRFRGRFIDKGGRVSDKPNLKGAPFVLMNVLDASATAAIRRALVVDGPAFDEFNAALDALSHAAAEPLDISPTREGETPQAADALALSATGLGERGYVTIVTGNDKATADAGDPVSFHVLKVSRELEVGRVIVIPHTNPFAEEVYVRHSGDFAGSVQDYEFDWRIVASVGDTKPLGGPEVWPRLLPRGPGDPSGNARLLKGTDQFSAQRVAVRYRLRSDPKRRGAPGDWTPFTDDQRVDSWLERVVAGVNVFDDYLDNFRNAKPDAVVSAVSRAGPRFRGATPLNVNALSRLGLIEVYETVFRRGKALGLDLGVKDAPLNESLQTFAGRLSDLYLLLGDEAYADAVDPTIALQSVDMGNVVASEELRAFPNQTGSLLHEELALLRGVAKRNTREPPEYNRLKWGFTDSLESSLYVANYGPFEDMEGLDRAERSEPYYAAQKAYPQGHGDAYGHYLMALKVYLQLLNHSSFEWITGRNEDSVGGSILKLDYYDERKIAQVAAARARTGLATIDLTHRLDYVLGAEGWLSLTHEIPGPDQRNPRRKRQLDAAWGTADWASRSGQGAYFDWVTANALLPATATERDEQLGKLDRESAPELMELADLGVAIQERLDAAVSGVNPVGAPEYYVPIFVGRDQGVSQNVTPFKVVLPRAERSLRKTVKALNSIAGARRHEIANRNEARLKKRVFEDEYFALETQLIEIFGTPYTSDIGPGKAYESGYVGPDFKRYYCVSSSELLQPDAKVFEWKPAGDAANRIGPDTISVTNDAWSQCVVEDPKARRESTGLIQRRMREVLVAAGALDRAVDEYVALIASIDDQRQLLRLTEKIEDEDIHIALVKNQEAIRLADFRKDALSRQVRFERLARYARYIGKATAEGIPKTVGFIAGFSAGVIADSFSPGRSAAIFAAVLASEGLQVGADDARTSALDADRRSQVLEYEAASKRLILSRSLRDASRTVEFEALLRREPILVDELYAHAEGLRAALDAYRTAAARGQRLLVERNRLSALQSIDNTNRRYREVAYRLLKRETVEGYRELLDRAILDVFMLVRLFDFETNYSPGDRRAIAANLYSELSRVRTPGHVTPDGPSKDRGGVASVLARLSEAYRDYADGPTARLPREQTLDIRHGLFRIPKSGEKKAGVDSDYDPRWREWLRLHLVDEVGEVPELRNCCEKMPDGAAIVIPFSTPVQTSLPHLGFNHFGFIAGPGETGFDVDYIGAKLTRVRVMLPGYNDRALVGRPQVYLVPAGSDLFVAPRSTSGDVAIRSWDINRRDEQRYAVPSGGGSSTMAERSLWFAPRSRHTDFGAIIDSQSKDAEEKQAFTTQLFGRSVFNTKWFLVIPLRPLSPELALTLGAEADEKIFRLLLGDANNSGITNIEIRFEFVARETGG